MILKDKTGVVELTREELVDQLSEKERYKVAGLILKTKRKEKENA
jgi:hypothetical protein